MDKENFNIGDLVGHRTEDGLGVLLELDWLNEHKVALVHFANKPKANWYIVEQHLENVKMEGVG